MFDLDTFTADTVPVLDALVAKCSFALNQITLNPLTEDLNLGETHSLTVGTNQLVGNTVSPKPNTDVTLINLDDLAFSFQGTSGANGEVQVPYDPLVNIPNYPGGTMNFKACLKDDPAVCATATATWVNSTLDGDQCSGKFCVFFRWIRSILDFFMGRKLAARCFMFHSHVDCMV
jgi:hypothetical protein